MITERTMKIKAIIEKGKDGLYAAYSEDHIGNSFFGGFGNSASEAKTDFIESVQEAIAENIAEGLDTPLFKDISVEYHYDLPSFFNCFDFINVRKFARYAGVNESKMRAYKSGAAYPGEKVTARIVKAIKTIGTDLSSASI